MFALLNFCTVMSGENNTSKLKLLPHLHKEHVTLQLDRQHKVHALQSNVASLSMRCPHWSFFKPLNNRFSGMTDCNKQIEDMPQQNTCLLDVHNAFCVEDIN